MLKPHIKLINIPTHTPEWFDFREQGIGASETGALLGLSDYTSSLELYHIKIGMKKEWTPLTAPTYWGLRLEDVIADTWRYYDGTAEGYLENYQNKKIARECDDVKGYAVNPKYPWLFASLDRAIKKGEMTLTDNRKLKYSSPLELKTANQGMLSKWTEGLPIYYVAQAFQQMIVTETDYAEVVIFDNYRKFEVYPIEWRQSYADKIIEATHNFWHKRVLPGREHFNELNDAYKNNNIEIAQRAQEAIDSLEPGPDGTEAYKEYMNKRFLVEATSVMGGMKDFAVAKEAVTLKEMSKMIDKLILERENYLKSIIKESQEMSFEEAGKITWNTTKSGTRPMYIKLKQAPNLDKIKAELSKVDIKTY